MNKDLSTILEVLIEEKSYLSLKEITLKFKHKKPELRTMQRELSKWTRLDPTTTKEIIAVATQEMKLLAGSENHKYCSPLIDLLSEAERYKLLETLFKIAQSDGEVSPAEEQEIRGIAQALGLPHRYFTAARAQIKV